MHSSEDPDTLVYYPPTVRLKVLPHDETDFPVRSQHRSGSPPRSSPLPAKRIPQESGWDYGTLDDNTDALGREPKRVTVNPGPSKLGIRRIFRPYLQTQFPLGIVEGGLTETPPLRTKKRYLPSPSLENSRLPSMEDNYTLPTRRTLQIASSDAALDSKRLPETSEIKVTQWSAQQKEAEERDKQREKQRTLEREREREREREAQRRLQPKSQETGGARSWYAVPEDMPPSDYGKGRPAEHDSTRSLPSRHGWGFGGYPKRMAGAESIPTNLAASWETSGGKITSLTLPPLTYRNNWSTEDFRATVTKRPTPLQPNRRKPLPPSHNAVTNV